MVFALTILLGFATTGSANNPKQNVKSHSIAKVNYYSVAEPKNRLHVPWHVELVSVQVQVVTTPPTTIPQNNAQVNTTPTIPASTDPSVVTPADEAAWEKVSMCEEGGNWSYQGSVYSGGLGMLNSTWSAYGGTEFAPNAGFATEDQQIIIAKRIQPNPPDQNGCTGSW